MAIVTIRGDLGGGAPEIGKRVSEMLHCDYVDREIIAKVAARIKSDKQAIAGKEMPEYSFLGRILEALAKSPPTSAIDGISGAYTPTWELEVDDARYLAGLEKVIKKIAEKDPVVIRGRGSQFILKNSSNTLHVLTIAPHEMKMKRVMEDQHVNEDEAWKRMTRFDNSRREFIKRYFNAELGDPSHYGLVINTGRFTYEQAASLVVGALKAA